jgi:dinuclear metal center YbgI/SA1388 family protein
MTTVHDVARFLDQFAPPRLAEEWDNVGLLVGDPDGSVARVMTCLTVTPATAAEAVQQQAELIVAHHPLPFQPLRRLTTETTPGRLLYGLISAEVAVYSPHTAFDSAAEGINQRLAAGLGLRDIAPLVPHDEGLGTGRHGLLPEPLRLEDLGRRLAGFLGVEGLGVVGDFDQPVRHVAVGCGAAGELLDAARRSGCDAMVLGEARFHACLEAEASGLGMLLPGHFASERFAVECLAEVLSRQFPDLEVWAASQERDPIRWLGSG